MNVTTDQFLEALTLIGQIAGPFAATVAAVAGVWSTFRSVKNTRTINTMSINVNGRLSQLLAMTKVAAHAQGVLAEKTRQETDKVDNSDAPMPTMPALPMPATDLPDHSPF